MGKDILDHNEVERLLSVMETGPPKSATAPLAPLGPPNEAGDLIRSQERIVPYDFKRPERVGKEQMRALQSLHEGFGRNFGAAISALLRTIVDVKLTSVDQFTYSEFVFSLESPTCFNLLRAKPLEGNLILDISPQILYPIIDRLLGGGKETGSVTRRPMTEIELRLVSRITNLFLDELKKAWENVVTLDLSVERVESKPQLVQIVPPNEVVILVAFELTLGDSRGTMSLCIPFNSIERIGSKLSSNSWVTYRSRESTQQTVAQVSQRLDASLVEIVVTLAETKIPTADLLGLRVGDVITTEKDARDRLDVSVQGVAKFLARPGAYKGHKAFRVEDTIARPPDPAPPES